MENWSAIWGKIKLFYIYSGKKAKKIRLHKRLDAHGGGDKRLMEYFAKDKLKTDISLSIESHLIGFAAEESRLNGGMPVPLCKFRKNA